jgi:hypothetical protein
MASRERGVLEQINNGKMSWGPSDNSPEAHERFQAEAEDLLEILDGLIAGDFIGDYTFKRESYSSNRHIVRVHVTKGLTFKGQDKSQWPE